jgi:hypothetical protein
MRSSKKVRHRKREEVRTGEIETSSDKTDVVRLIKVK